MEIIISWLIFAFIVAFVFGVARTIGFWGSLLVSLIFSPLIGLFITLCFKTVEEDKRQKQMLKTQQDILKATAAKRPEISVTKELDKLIEYRNSGAIDEQEFQKLKNKLLSAE